MEKEKLKSKVYWIDCFLQNTIVPSQFFKWIKFKLDFAFKLLGIDPIFDISVAFFPNLSPYSDVHNRK